MEERNDQNLENQNAEKIVNPESSNFKTKQPLSEKVKMAIIISATAIAVVAIALILIFVVFEHTCDWTNEIVKLRTCTETGITKSTCNICGEIRTHDVPSSGHNYGYQRYQEIQPNCLVEGKAVRYCEACGYEDSYVIPAKTSHDFHWAFYTVTKEATCTTEGEKEYHCTNYNCDEIMKEIIPASHQYSNIGMCTVCNRGMINIILPTTPITVHDFKSNGSIDETCKITDIYITYINKNYDGTYKIIFSWAGEKTYDDNGNNYSSSVGFAYKLYDSNGYVVKSGSDSSVGVCVGEKFRDQELEWSYADLDPSETYTLEILNLD